MTHLLGAHQSAAGGHHNALTSISEKGGNCLQLFSSSPRSWADAHLSHEEIKKFAELANTNTISPVYFHARYLINLADPGKTGAMSVHTLIHELDIAAKMNIRGSVVHTGTFHNGKLGLIDYASMRDTDLYKGLILNIKTVLEKTPDNTVLILENAGVRKIGQTIEQLANIIQDVSHRRLRVCLDTCHLHAAGYNLRTAYDFNIFIDRFDELIGLGQLELVHINDSKDAFGALRDRHENLGKGYVGEEVFKNFLNHPKTKHLPFIIETPGFDNKGPDKANIDILKGYIE